MFTTMVKAIETAPPQWWETMKEVFVMGWSSPIFYMIMIPSIIGALLAWRLETRGK